MGLPNFTAWKGVLGLRSISRREDGSGSVFLRVPPRFAGGAGQEASLAAGFVCANGRAGERVDGGADSSGLQAAAAGAAVPARLQDHPQGRQGWQRPAHPQRGRQAGSVPGESGPRGAEGGQE